MSAGVPTLPLGLDPLIAEAKQRARRRRLLALVSVVVVAAVAAGTTYELRSSGNNRGVCATPPLGWKARLAPPFPLPSPAAIVMTNWRFGRMDYLYGLGDDSQNWPAGGVTVVVRNEGPAATPPIARDLRVARADFGAFEGIRYPFAERAIRVNGRFLDAWVKLGALTPATIAAANEALAGVRVCSA